MWLLMKRRDKKPTIFISHSSTDTWVAKQIATHIKRRCGVSSFLDETEIQHGEDFEEKIRQAANVSSELLVLLTPWAMSRPYIWMEIGLFWGKKKRVVGVLHGLTTQDVSKDRRIPVLLKKIDLVYLNEIDGYFTQLRQRAKAWKRALSGSR